MNAPKGLAISDFSYVLPAEKIAAYPLSPRDASKLLVYRSGAISEDTYSNIAAHLPANSLLIFNDTKVVFSRLLFYKPTGSTIEIFCLEPDARYPDITSGMLQRREVFWKCLVGKSGKWKEKELNLKFDEGRETLTVSISQQLPDSFIIHLQWTGDFTFAEVLQRAGAVPLPPYIKRPAEISDRETYQTIFGKFEGSVAAPTAGLHFTPAVFESLEKKDFQWEFVTLHVGAGTFKPVKTETIGEHEMHAEWMEVKAEVIEHLLQQTEKKLPVVAIGTTALRTIESLYQLGVKAATNENFSIDTLNISQWEVYEEKEEIAVSDALKVLLNFLQKNKLERIVCKTQIMIAPGYDFKIASALVTNFHQPNSTLLLLIAAFAGNDWKRIYDYALENSFRFLSYGDGSLLIREKYFLLTQPAL